MKNLLITTFMLLGLMAFAQNDLPNREAFTLKLAVDNDQFYEMDVEKSAYLPAEKVLQIYPGEKVFVEAEIKADTIFSMKTVKEIKFPERTISIEFKQSVKEDGKGHEQMLLSVKNPFGKYLAYNAAMYIVGHDEWIDTSIIPVYPKIVGYEMWNDVIISIVLHSWRLQDKP
ncbi:hypothetical protein AM493_02645 [Flavobacterium akiainvivens]|uniref:Uncharacterized protein n=1 Tax=Flavobacterium akiainvivens TaxID=1202724 RepID=A0A0M9VH07_9FLAO|nr:hypothetical protein [Flavobacterium akiainvivens]KOS05052.1 hypothetical protein AM493_02645 [Flavobacterium akiainvivens]SFQ52161.1 hypothetical protein SAMN05444144_106275 [Flavobacterium akiainvivens]